MHTYMLRISGRRDKTAKSKEMEPYAFQKTILKEAFRGCRDSVADNDFIHH